MPRRIFISYNFNDRNIAHNVIQFFQPSGGKCQGKPIFVENDVSSEGPEAIETEIRRVIKKCSIALFVIGNNNHNSPWIIKEAEIVSEKKMPIVAVKHPDSSGGLPKLLRKKNVPFVQWKEKSLAAVLNLIK